MLCERQRPPALRASHHPLPPPFQLAEVFDGCTPADLKRELEGRVLKEAHRVGKQMWLELDNGTNLLLHFGMTGEHWQGGCGVRAG